MSNDLKTAMQKWFDMQVKDMELYSTVGKVTNVDTNKRTCTVAPINGDPEITDCRLQADESGSTGFVMIPAVNSNVIVTWLNNTTAYVARMQQVDSVMLVTEGGETFELDGQGNIKLNGDNLGGLLKVANVLNRMNQIEQSLSNLYTAFNAHIHTTPSGASGVPTAPGTDTTGQTQRADIENDKVKHGG